MQLGVDPADTPAYPEIDQAVSLHEREDWSHREIFLVFHFFIPFLCMKLQVSLVGAIQRSSCRLVFHISIICCCNAVSFRVSVV